MSIAHRRFWFLLAALVSLRVVIGFHFFHEGWAKLRAGDFSAAPFFSAAVGPWAPVFHNLVEDHDYARRLCVERSAQAGGKPDPSIDPTLTLALWDDFVDRAQATFRWSDGDRELADEIVSRYAESLEEWLASNRDAVLAHFQSAARETAFDRDGPHAARTAAEVASLREQRAEIRADRRRQVAQWAAEVEALWDGLEAEINAVSGPAPGQLVPPIRVVLHRPFDQPQSRIKWIDRVVPWFDVAIGLLLIVGFLTPWAALAGAAFLVGVMAAQPPWVAEAQSTSYQLIECIALLVVASSMSGRVFGLDFFWHTFRRKPAPTDQPAREDRTAPAAPRQES